MKTKMKGGLLEKAPGVWLIKISAGPDPKKPGRYLQRHEVFRGNKTEAKARRAELQAQVKKGDTLDGRKLTVKQWIEHWLATHGEQQVSEKTRERYAQILNNHVVPTLGATRLRRLTAVQIEGLYSSLIQAGKLSGRSIRHCHVVLGTALGKAERLGLLQDNPMKRVDAPAINPSQIVGDGKGGGEKVRVLSADQIAALIRGADRFDLQHLIALGAATGARLGELLALRWGDLDRDRMTLRIERAIQDTLRDGAVVKSTKTRSSRRTIGLDQGTVDMLKKRRARQAEDALALGVSLPPDALMFPRSALEPTTPRRTRHVCKQFRTVADALGLGAFTFHCLRHSHGSHLLDANVPLPSVSARLGHANVGITAAVYSHYVKRAEDQAAEVTGRLLRSVLSDI